MITKIVPLRRGFSYVSAIYQASILHGGVICGGYARYACSPLAEPPYVHDVDIFLTQENHKDICDAIITLGYKEVANTKWAKTFEALVKVSAPTDNVQVIYHNGKYKQTAIEDILESFDFTIARAAIMTPTTVMIDEELLEHESSKELHVRDLKQSPVITMKRISKYLSKGYTIKNTEILKVVTAYLESNTPQYCVDRLYKAFSNKDFVEETYESDGGETGRFKKSLNKLLETKVAILEKKINDYSS